MSDHCNGVADQQGFEEVKVDERALVNILSRYPGTFDVLRELIQNADDAEARSVDVHFETKEAKESQPATKLDVSKLNVCKWIIKNDGTGFKDEDWERLGKIAAGNVNSTKVGAFGVGFYSVLSKSNRPLVRSNGKSLQFYKGEDGKLCKRFSPLDSSTSPDSLTSVELELRDPEPLGLLADLTRFLVSSVAFLANIGNMSVYLDSQRVLRIQKSLSSPVVDIPIPQHLKPTTPLGALTVERIQRTVQRIVVDAEESAFASSSTSSSPVIDTDALVERPGRSAEDRPTRTCRSVDAILEDNAITHDLYTAMTRVNLDEQSEIKKGVESTMKSLPPSFKCKAVYFNSEQSLVGIDNSQSPKAKQLAPLFCGSHGIFPANDSGRLVVGQSTNQTTGIGLHIAAHFLPTMERGAIDLANGQVKVWNKEVLHVGGFLARVVYEEEMHLAAKAKDDRATQLGLCTMDRFAFGPTAPHSGVSKILQNAFFSCCYELKSPFPVVSDVGISCAREARFRQNNKDLSFLKWYQVLHEEVHQRSEIIRRYEIPLFKFGDIVKEFETGATQEVMKSFFVWWEDVHKNPPSTPKQKDAREDFRKSFRSRVVLRSSNGVETPLKQIKYFTFFPLPSDLSHPHNMYVDVTLGVPTRDAVKFFGWAQLPLLDWLKHVCSQARQLASSEDSGQVSDVGYRILRVLVQFALVEHLSAEQWGQAAEHVKDLKCVPTAMGLQFPASSYFSMADVCGDLPVARETDFLDIPVTSVAIQMGFVPKLVNEEHIRNVLTNIQVRQMMTPKAWGDMVERLETDASKDSNYRLLRYLAMIPKGESADRQINDSKEKKVFYSENHLQASANELLFPNEDVRKLGLSTLALPSNGINSLQNDVDPSGSLKMESFIDDLGIQKLPTLDKIIAQAASDKLEIRRPALEYLLSHLKTDCKDYKYDDFTEYAFIPTKCGSLARPNKVFASPVWEKLGFKQVPEDSRRNLSRLGVKEDPSIDTITEYLKTPETTLPDLDTARIWFENLYLHGKLSTRERREQLSTIPFVPVKNPSSPSSESSRIEYISPKDCFITSTETKDHYRHNFPFVDFGQNGNSFLESCCAKKSPDASDIARKMARNPQSYLEALGNDTKLYLDDLRTIASQLDSISEEDKQAMKKAPMFLANGNGVDAEKLLPAEQVFISDWAGRDFARHVSVVPQGDILEQMYREMGSVFLGTYVQHEICPIRPKAECNLPFNRNQVIWRIRCFMKQRDKSEKTDVSFYVQGSTNNLRVKACKCLKSKKIFAPPYGVATDDTKATQIKAGLKFNEDDESHTLWMVEGSSGSDLYNDIAVALCHVLFKTYERNDVLLLTSLFAKSDETLKKYYPGEMEEVPSIPDEVKPDHKSKHKLKNWWEALKRNIPAGTGNGDTRWGDCEEPPKDDMEKAIALLCKSHPDGKIPDFSGPSQTHPMSHKQQNRKCKQVRTRMLERVDLRDQATEIKFSMARGAKGPSSGDLKEKITEFADVTSRLAKVFCRKASTLCHIFWTDTDRDLMAFTRDNVIFLNLAHYHYYKSPVEGKEEMVTEWYLIMAHEIAHIVAKDNDHDECHGSLSTRFAITHFPALREQFSDISW